MRYQLFSPAYGSGDLVVGSVFFVVSKRLVPLVFARAFEHVENRSRPAVVRFVLFEQTAVPYLTLYRLIAVYDIVAVCRLPRRFGGKFECVGGDVNRDIR